MEILENNTQQDKTNDKKFTDSQITLNNRKTLNITGVEKVYETNENKIQVKVAGVNLIVTGEGLNITRLDVEAGIVQVDGVVNELKYTNTQQKGNFLKKMFK